MKDAALDILETMETMDKRLANVEEDSSQSAAALEELAKNTAKTQELYLAMAEDIGQLKSMFENYLEATKHVREEQRRVFLEAREAKGEALRLVSEVREKLRVPGG